MPEVTEYAPGTPSWVDLGTPDMEAAKAFYGRLFGWELADTGEEGGHYQMALKEGKAVAGLGPQQQPGPPYWTTYVSVDSADATAAAVRGAGGTVLMEPMDVLDAGRIAVFADPTGAPFSVWQPGLHLGAQLANEPGTFCWNELETRDPETASAFYSAVFAWKPQTEAEPIPYTQFFRGDASVAGMMDIRGRVPDEVPAHWLVYFTVADCDATVAEAQAAGGSVMVEPVTIPTGRFAIVNDPQGAFFGVIAMTGADG